MKSDVLYDLAKEAINKVANNTAVPLETVLEDLRGLYDEIEMAIEAIEADIDANKSLD